MRDGFALADFVLLVVGRGRRQPSFLYDKRRLWSAAVVSALGHFGAVDKVSQQPLRYVIMRKTT